MRLSLDQVWGVRVLSWRLKFLSATSFNLHVWRKIDRTRIDLKRKCCRGYLESLHMVVGFWFIFGVWGAQFWFNFKRRASNERYFIIELRPWGLIGSNGPEMTLKNLFFGPTNPQGDPCFILQMCFFVLFFWSLVSVGWKAYVWGTLCIGSHSPFLGSG